MKLSNLELEVMRLVWRDKDVIVPELHEASLRQEDLEYLEGEIARELEKSGKRR